MTLPIETEIPEWVKWVAQDDVATFGGITIRDYFAAKAMHALIMKLPLRENPEDTEYPDAVSSGAYDYADSMLAERAK